MYPESQPSPFKSIFWWLLLICVGRLMPHAPNVTPLLAVCILVGWYHQRGIYYALAFTLLSLLLSDTLLAMLHGGSILGSWSLFTYTGFASITLLAYYWQNLNNSRFVHPCLFVLLCSLFYWIWSNFGVWLGGYYGYSLSGLVACYTMALPFLPRGLMNDLGWFVLLLGWYHYRDINLKRVGQIEALHSPH